MHRPAHVSQWKKGISITSGFIHELFLYVIAILIRYERFRAGESVTCQPYYLPGNSDYGRDVIVSFTGFCEGVRSLAHRNQRLELKRLSVRADFLERRSKGSGVDFRALMQADFVLFMRAAREVTPSFSDWWPDTLVYVGRFHSAFEIFARSVSKSYFDRVKCLLGIDQASDLSEQLAGYKADPSKLPRWQYDSFSPAALLGAEQLCKKP